VVETIPNSENMSGNTGFATLAWRKEQRPHKREKTKLRREKKEKNRLKIYIIH